VSEPSGRRAILAACIALAMLCLSPLGARAASPLELGFFDGAFLGTAGSTWLQRASSAGAGWVRIDIGWNAPNTAAMPAGFDARNPADPGYSFTTADAAIRTATADGLQVLVTFTGAPPWAEGPGMPSAAPPGTWRPDPRAIGDYGVALARRYSGHFPDPLHPGRMLPRVAAFQPWNEPNLSKYLTPQWSGNQPASPAIYRSMLNAFYAGVKSVDANALVVAAGTAPFGDPFTGAQRMPPVMFWRGVLCLREVAGALRGAGCRDPAHFDVLAHHPYSVGSPDTPAFNPDDVSIPDLGKLTRLLRAAERSGGALPHIHHRLWVTEVGYNTKPPNPGGVPVVEDARWLEQTLELLWSQGVDAIFWNTIVDQPPNPTYQDSSQAGVYFVDARPKPALQAFQFPLVALRAHGSVVEVWGRAPAGGRLAIERRTGSSWRTVRTLEVTTYSTFLVRIKHKGDVSLRAAVGGQTSLAWRLG
jgi:hypothetical protein